MQLHLVYALFLADACCLLAYLGKFVAVDNPASGKDRLKCPYAGSFAFVYNPEREEVEHVIFKHVIMCLEPCAACRYLWKIFGKSLAAGLNGGAKIIVGHIYVGIICYGHMFTLVECANGVDSGR